MFKVVFKICELQTTMRLNRRLSFQLRPFCLMKIMIEGLKRQLIDILHLRQKEVDLKLTRVTENKIAEVLSRSILVALEVDPEASQP